MISKVTERFIEVHEKLLQQKRVKSSRQFALMLDYLPQSLSEIINRRRDVNIELLRKAIETFQLNPIYLFSGKGDIYYEEMEATVKEITLVTNAAGESKIMYVPSSLHEKYALHLLSDDVVKELPTFSLPDPSYNSEYYRCFEMKGDRMEPTVFDSERLIGRYVEPIFWKNSIKENLVYIFVTKSEVIISRVLNLMAQTKSIVLAGDNKYYHNETIKLNDLSELWQVTMKMSPFLSSPKNPNDIFKFEMEQLIHTNKILAENIKDMDKHLKDLTRRDQKRELN